MKKLFVLAVLAMGLVGCATTSSVQNKLVNNTLEGVIYGSSGVDTEANVKKLCDSIKNRDNRCAKPDNYVVVVSATKIGFSDGLVGMNVLVEKNNPLLSKLYFKGDFNDKNAPYAKVKVIAGQYGELLDVVSTNGDGKCYWSGLPKAGGTVCPAYGYDYRKDFIGVVYR